MENKEDRVTHIGKLGKAPRTGTLEGITSSKRFLYWLLLIPIAIRRDIQAFCRPFLNVWSTQDSTCCPCS